MHLHRQVSFQELATNFKTVCITRSLCVSDHPLPPFIVVDFVIPPSSAVAGKCTVLNKFLSLCFLFLCGSCRLLHELSFGQPQCVPLMCSTGRLKRQTRPAVGHLGWQHRPECFPYVHNTCQHYLWLYHVHISPNEQQLQNAFDRFCSPLSSLTNIATKLFIIFTGVHSVHHDCSLRSVQHDAGS